MDIQKIIQTNADNFIKEIEQNNGKAKPGHNGPYHDKETPVRNSGHIAILLLKAYEKTQEPKYKIWAEKLLEYLMSKEARPYNYTFHHRGELETTKGKDKCNGVIGQAWSIEALMKGYEIIGNEKYQELAKKIYKLHKFNPTIGLWKRCSIEGKTMREDLTLNHQIWFASIGTMIKDEKIEQEIKQFLNKLDKNLETHKNGLIKHMARSKYIRKFYMLKNKLMKTKIDEKYLYNKEASYHAFNLYALARLQNKHPEHEFFKSEKYKKITEYAISEEHITIASENKYGFSYNPSGIELAYFLKIQKEQGLIIANELIEKAIELQLEKNMNKETKMLSENTDDPETLKARIYELCEMI